MKPHWTPYYVLARLRELCFHKTNPHAPWLGPKAVKTLDRLLQPHMTGVECGAGRSTPWVARRVQCLESWEEEEAWETKVRALLLKKGIRNAIVKSVMPNPDSYKELLDKIPEKSLHFALVDSEHCRDSLCLGFISKLKSGGFLMLDNANWFLPSLSRAPRSRSIGQGAANELWDDLGKIVLDWDVVWTSSGVTDTAFFIKP